MIKMLSFKFSNISEIKSLIYGLKSLYSAKTEDEIVSLYHKSSISSQRTLHIKFLVSFLSGYSYKFMELYKRNPEYKRMISDIIKDSHTLTSIEISDLITWYRRSISAGCSEILSEDEYKIFCDSASNFNNFSDRFNVNSSLYFNLATLNIKNSFIKEGLLKNSLYFRCIDYLMILQSMNMNPNFFDSDLVEFAYNKPHLILNNNSKISDVLKMLRYYKSICKNYNLPANEQFISQIFQCVDSFVIENPYSIMAATQHFLYSGYENIIDSYKEKCLNYLSSKLDDPLYSYFFVETFRRDRHIYNELKQKAYKTLNETLEGNIKKKAKSKLLLYMSLDRSENLFPEELAVKCIQKSQRSTPVSTSMLRSIGYYPEVAGKSIFELDEYKSWEPLITDENFQLLDLIEFDEVIFDFADIPAKNVYYQNILDKVIKEIKRRTSKDKRIADYYYFSIYNQNVLNNSELREDILKIIKESIR